MSHSLDIGAGGWRQYLSRLAAEWRWNPPSKWAVSTAKKCDTFSICACHPCAGAMLIFSVSFQFLRMTGCDPGSDPISAHSSNR